MDAWLIVIRAAHFAATALTAGVLAFLVLVAQPALGAIAQRGSVAERSSAAIGNAWVARCLGIARAALAATLLSGMAWVAIEIVEMTELSLDEAMRDGLVTIILTRTTFGLVADLRLGLALLLALALALATAAPAWRPVALAGAAALLASLAWAGHAVGTVGAMGPVHVAADALHLLAAGAWIGGLVPLALMLAAARRHPDDQGAGLVYGVVRRFSVLGMISVSTLILTGCVHAWILVGSWHALTDTTYGRLLMVKLGLFAALLTLAIINRLVLTPRLAAAGPVQADALRQFVRTGTTEIALGVLIFAIVGALGTQHPAIHLVAP